MEKKEKKYIPQRLKMLVAIVNRGKADFYIDFLEQFKVNMQLVAMGEGSAPNNVINLWGSIHKERDVIFAFVQEDKAKTILKSLEEKFEKVKHGSGVAFTVPLNSIIGVYAYQFLSDNRKRGKIKNDE